MNSITFGVHLPIIRFDGNTHSREQILSFADRAEKLGYDSLSVNDYVVFTASWLDAVTTLSAVAGITNKIQLGTPILNIVIRNPIISVIFNRYQDRYLLADSLQVSGLDHPKKTTMCVEYPMKISGKGSTRFYRYYSYFGIKWQARVSKFRWNIEVPMVRTPNCFKIP